MRKVIPLVLAGAALVAVSACGATVPGIPAAAAPPRPLTAVDAGVPTALPVPPTAPRAAGAVAAPRAGLAAAADGLRPFLITAEDVGAGFTDGTEPRPDATVPAICGGPGVVARYPDAVRVGVGFDGPGGTATVQEAVSVYADMATARRAFDAGAAGLDCSQGTVSGKPVVVTPAEDLTVDVGGEQALGWRVGGEGFDVVLIAVRSDEVVMTFTFLGPEGGASGLPDPLAVSAHGVRKLVG